MIYDNKHDGPIDCRICQKIHGGNDNYFYISYNAPKCYGFMNCRRSANGNGI